MYLCMYVRNRLASFSLNCFHRFV